MVFSLLGRHPRLISVSRDGHSAGSALLRCLVTATGEVKRRLVQQQGESAIRAILVKCPYQFYYELALTCGTDEHELVATFTAGQTSDCGNSRQRSSWKCSRIGQADYY